MYTSGLAGVVGYAAVIVTVIQFLSGLIVCWQYKVNRSTGEASPLPFIFGVMSSAVWLLYGLIQDNSNIIRVNTVGVTLMLFYTIVFYIYSPKRSDVMKLMVLLAVFLVSIILYTDVYEDNYAVLVERLGTLACFLTLVTVAAPLSKLFYVMKVKCTECLPFPLILMSFLVSSLWFLYGLLIDDSYLIVPNFLSMLLALFQLCLFFIYPSKPQSPVLFKSMCA